MVDRAPDEPPSTGIPDEMLCFAVYAAAHAFTKAYRPLLAGAGLTYPQYLAMTLLWRRDGRSVGEIAEPLFLDSGTVTPLLKRLKTAGLVRSAKDGRDERQTRVWLTEAGRALEGELASTPEAIGCAAEITPDEARRFVASSRRARPLPSPPRRARDRAVRMSAPSDLAVADAPAANWVDRLAPAAFRPWLRLARYDRPIGSWLLMWPCWWSAALAACASGRLAQLPWHLALFLVGAFVMRGAGSTWNDILDRDIDARVERTRNRPVASGRIRARHALVFAVAQSLVGLLVLVQFNGFTIALGILSLAPVAVYPLMKRVVSAPQAVLGLCFAYGALMGWAAVFGSLAGPAVALYLGAIAWVIGYDTVYGHQDQRDDAIIGVRSTSRTFGRRSREIIAGLYVAAILLVGAAIAGTGASWPAWAGLAGFAAHLAWQIATLDPDDPARCLRLFRANRDAGLILFLGLLAAALTRA